jgi:hypothetical protein
VADSAGRNHAVRGELGDQGVDGTVRDWEQGAHRPDKAAQVLLTVIGRDPDAVARALES